MSAFTALEHAHHLELQFHIAESANAFSLNASRELTQLQKQYRQWTKPLVVRSTHRSMFCSGGNLRDYRKLKTKAAGIKVNREIQSALLRFARWPVIKLAVVEGDVLGGGMEWLGAFDFRWCTPYALFSFWQRRIGLATGWGGGQLWASKIGEEKVRQLLLEAHLMSADEALRLGLVERKVSSWAVSETVERWARQMDQPSVQALAGWSVKTEGQIFKGLWMGGPHRAALRKFSR